MINALLISLIIAICPPDISNVSEDNIELHPTLGMVMTLDSGVQVAYPVYDHIYVERCTFHIKKDKYNLTFSYCYGRLLYILGEPTLFKPVGEYDWKRMDYYPCQKGGK